MLAEAEDMNKIEDDTDQGNKKKGKKKGGGRKRNKKRQRDEDGYETDHQVLVNNFV